jgi:ABC-type multidrug transport system permease subunit
MARDVEVGVVGSLTMIVLFSSVYFLLRNFYKRFNRLNENEAPNQENEAKD